jgi:hypothetical protein
MSKANVIFNKLIQDSQDYGSNDDHMVSRVFFTIEVDGNSPQECYVDIKQSVGSDIETSPLEVSKPVGYKGSFDYGELREAVEGYYRSLIGSQGSGINISGGSNIRMRNNTFIQKKQILLEVSNSENLAW